MKPILETTVEDVRGPLEFSVLGAVAATTVIGPMLERGSGTILFTTGGAAINPHPLRAGVGISFAGEVAYALMLHDEVKERGVPVGHTAIGGRRTGGRPRAGRHRQSPLAPSHRPKRVSDKGRHRLTLAAPAATRSDGLSVWTDTNSGLKPLRPPMPPSR